MISRRIDEIPELREKQRECVRHHNARALILLCTFFLLIFGSLSMARNFAKPGLVVVSLTAGVLFLGAFLIYRSDRLFARKIGFICPKCDESLYYASDIYGSRSSVIKRGTCPHCGTDIVALLKKRSQSPEVANRSPDPTPAPGMPPAGQESRQG
jgi:hypothetical protein